MHVGPDLPDMRIQRFDHEEYGFARAASFEARRVAPTTSG
jgi:hypothetical protein